MIYKCIEGFVVDTVDGDGFTIEEGNFIVEEGSIWEVNDEAVNVTGGEIHLENEKNWIEVSVETLEQCFVNVDMKEFYGNLSIVINMNFSGIKASSIEEAEEIVKNATFNFELVKEDSEEVIDTDIQGWHIADEVGRGNVTESDLSDFSIEQEE